MVPTTGLEPALNALEGRCLSIRLRGHLLISAERLELPFTASETGVLPVRRNGIKLVGRVRLEPTRPLKATGLQPATLPITLYLPI